MPDKRKRVVRSVDLTAHPDLDEWAREAKLNFSGVCVQLLYALRAYHERGGDLTTALPALAVDLAAGGDVSSSGPGTYVRLSTFCIGGQEGDLER
jgi:hypothetical protein